MGLTLLILQGHLFTMFKKMGGGHEIVGILVDDSA